MVTDEKDAVIRQTPRAQQNWPVMPVIPATVSSGDKVLAAHENASIQCFADLWTNIQASVFDSSFAPGDLLVRDSNAMQRLPSGTDGESLVADSASPLGLSWQPVGTIGSQGDPGPVGPQGPQGPPGNTGAPGPLGPKGDTGAPGPQGIQGAGGPAGVQGPAGGVGPQGPAGPQGQAGTGVEIKGSVATAADLPVTGNATGDSYIVQDTGHLWSWDGTKWVDGGEIQGPPGAAGATGPQGPQGMQGPQGLPGTTGSQGPIGATGAAGQPGPVIPATASTLGAVIVGSGVAVQASGIISTTPWTGDIDAASHNLVNLASVSATTSGSLALITGSALAQRLSIDSAGHCTIGATDDAAASLTLVDDLVMTNNVLHCATINGGISSFRLYCSDLIITGRGGSGIWFRTSGNETNRLIIDYNGHCTIGTPDDSGPALTTPTLAVLALPSAAPAAGSKQLWYDPADGNRVKYAP
jgi:hypothetical protein